MELALVDDSYSLTLASSDGLGSYEVNGRADTEHAAESILEGAFLSGDILDRVVKLLGGKLNVNVKGVVVVDSAELYLIVGREAFVKKHSLYLRGEYVNAADYHHIVASAHGL